MATMAGRMAALMAGATWVRWRHRLMHDHGEVELTPWVPVIAPVATVIVPAVGAIPAYRQLSLKAAEEGRLSRASRAEVDVRLMGAFVPLMKTAHARGEYVLADAALQSVFTTSGPLPPTTPEDLGKLLKATVVGYPVGTAEQSAVIAAIARLGS